jgi:hypothetical protein
MKAQSLEFLLTGALLALLGQVAAFGGAVLWGNAVGASPAAGLSGALYAPFGLVALLAPGLAAPLARRALELHSAQSGSADQSPWSSPWRFVALLGIAETLYAAARLAGGASALAPLPMHGLLAVHAAVATIVFRRSKPHASGSPPTET